VTIARTSDRFTSRISAAPSSNASCSPTNFAMDGRISLGSAQLEATKGATSSAHVRSTTSRTNAQSFQSCRWTTRREISLSLRPSIGVRRRSSSVACFRAFVLSCAGESGTLAVPIYGKDHPMAKAQVGLKQPSTGTLSPKRTEAAESGTMPLKVPVAFRRQFKT